MKPRAKRARRKVVKEGVLERIERKLDQVVALMGVVLVTQGAIMIELDELESEVNETQTVEESAIVLLEGIIDRLDQAGTDKVKLVELRDKLKQSKERLAAAVANIPPAPTP